MRHLLPAILVLLLFLLHQDLWFWRSAQPLLLGLLPPGLWYHAAYALATAALMWWLVRNVFPDHLERD